MGRKKEDKAIKAEKKEEHPKLEGQVGFLEKKKLNMK